jgi:type I restriction enzyme S subunit
MTEWRECKLENIFCIVKEVFKPSNEQQFKYIGLEHIEQGSLRLNGWGYSNSVQSNKYFFKKDDVLFGKLRPYFRKIIKAPFDGVCSTDIWVCRAKNNFDQNFLFYFLANQEFVDTANSTDEGTRMPRADWSFLKKTIWNIPPLPEQKAIAEVLSSLDDKIDLLTRQNKTLEDLAQAYFRKWFIEDASDEWEVGKLGDYIEIHDSKRVPLSKIEREKMKSGTLYPYYGAATIMDYVNDYIFDGEYILMGEDGTVETEDGYPVLQYATGKFWVNNHAHVLTAKSPFNNYFIWFFLKQCNISGIVTGAVQPKINQENLKNIDIPIPDLTLINSANQFFANIFAKILNNLEQIKTFQKLRDTLLPKLISGEIRLKM